MDKVTPKDVFQANRDRAAPLLAKLKAESIGHMIDGKIVPSISGLTFETKSPIDGVVLANVARGTADDIDRAATAASLAFKSWRDMPAVMRRKLLHRVADAIEDRADDIAVLECIDTGQAHRFMAKAAIRAAENFRFFADKCTEARDGLNMPSGLAASPTRDALWVVNSNANTVATYTIDKNTGNLAFVASTATDAGPVFNFPRSGGPAAERVIRRRGRTGGRGGVPAPPRVQRAQLNTLRILT